MDIKPVFLFSFTASCSCKSLVRWHPGRLQSMGSQKVRHNRVTSLHFASLHFLMHMKVLINIYLLNKGLFGGCLWRFELKGGKKKEELTFQLCRWILYVRKNLWIIYSTQIKLEDMLNQDKEDKMFGFYYAYFYNSDLTFFQWSSVSCFAL